MTRGKIALFRGNKLYKQEVGSWDYTISIPHQEPIRYDPNRPVDVSSLIHCFYENFEAMGPPCMCCGVRVYMSTNYMKAPEWFYQTHDWKVCPV